MPQPFFKEEFPSTFEAMAATLDRAVENLIQRGWIRKEHEPCARLCLEEALTNAVRHGNKQDPERKVRLEMVECGKQCKIKVGDEGNGFRPEHIEVPECDHMGGRGIVLIRHYMDKVRYSKRDNCLEMVFQRQDVNGGKTQPWRKKQNA